MKYTGDDNLINLELYRSISTCCRAITKHLSPSSEKAEKRDAPTSDHEKGDFSKISELITSEQCNVLKLVNTALDVAPSMLKNDIIKRDSQGINANLEVLKVMYEYIIRITLGTAKLSQKAKNKILDYYQEVLWREVGIFLEHAILWWGQLPLSTRPPHSSQHLREWIDQLLSCREYQLLLVCPTNDQMSCHVCSRHTDKCTLDADGSERRSRLTRGVDVVGPPVPTGPGLVQTGHLWSHLWRDA